MKSVRSQSLYTFRRSLSKSISDIQKLKHEWLFECALKIHNNPLKSNPFHRRNNWRFERDRHALFILSQTLGRGIMTSDSGCFDQNLKCWNGPSELICFDYFGILMDLLFKRICESIVISSGSQLYSHNFSTSCFRRLTKIKKSTHSKHPMLACHSPFKAILWYHHLQKTVTTSKMDFRRQLDMN